MVEYLLFFRGLTNIYIFTTFNIFVVLKSLQTRPSHKGVRLTLCDSIPTYNRTLFSDTRSGISVVTLFGFVYSYAISFMHGGVLWKSSTTTKQLSGAISYITLQLAVCWSPEIRN